MATIFGGEEVTGEEFADHLIRKYGKKELELFVNKRVVARAFARRGWTLAADEVRRAVDDDCRGMGVTRGQFEADVLPRYNKTPDEWAEDVVAPRLMLARLCETTLAVPTEAELRQAFAARHGEKVQCRIITWAKDQGDHAREVYASFRGDPREFERYGREHPRVYHALATPRTPMPGAEGEGHGAVAKLRAGEMTPLVATKDGYFVALCAREVPADGGRRSSKRGRRSTTSWRRRSSAALSRGCSTT